jgi:hypothetical protein
VQGADVRHHKSLAKQLEREAKQLEREKEKEKEGKISG